MHGAGGTVGSGYRVLNYRALSAGHPLKVHVLTFDYGRSPERRPRMDFVLMPLRWLTGR